MNDRNEGEYGGCQGEMIFGRINRRPDRRRAKRLP
jgi:hypothetical protein